MQQHAFGRIDPQPCEQFRIAQRQFDHFTQGLNGVTHPANIIIIDQGAAAAIGLFIFSAQLNLGIFIDIDDAFRRG